MRASTDSLGIRRFPTTCGRHKAVPEVTGASVGASCRAAWPWAAGAMDAAAAREKARRERLERVRTDRNKLPRRLPPTRSTLKIRTPSVLKNDASTRNAGESLIIWEP